MTTKTNYPKAFSHIGITVPNIKEAVKFYGGNGLVHYYGTIHSKKEKETAIGQMCIDVLVKIGKNLKLRI
jgi:hypothetical protein